MAILIITPQGKAYCVPECDHCGSKLIPKYLNIESGIWICPNCTKEKEEKNDL